MLLFSTLATLFGIAYSGCNVAEIRGFFKNGQDNTPTNWNLEIGLQISPNTDCISYKPPFSTDVYSGKWLCQTDNNGNSYLKYNIYKGSTDCSTGLMDFTNFWTQVGSLFDGSTQLFKGLYVFSGSSQAQLVLGTSINALPYFTGTVSCSISNVNCGITITEKIYNSNNECGTTDVLWSWGTSELVSGLCAASVNAEASLNCTVLEQFGINTQGIDACQTGITFEWSTGYVCKDNAIWIMQYDKANCQGAYTGFKIEEKCYTSIWGGKKASLEISCSNPGYAGALSTEHKSGDVAEYSNSSANNIFILFSFIIVFIMFLIQ